MRPEPNVRELDAAIFDLGGVLTTPILASFADFEKKIGVPEGTLIRIFIGSYSEAGQESDFHLLETGKISEEEYYRRLGAKLREATGLDVRLPDDPVEVRRGMFSSIAPNEEMIEAARRIADHYPTGLLTNNVKEWGGWRQYYPQDIFTVVVDSSEVGMRKPDPRIYLMTCERLGVTPDRAAFVDDISGNVEGARTVGLHAIHFTETSLVLEELRQLFPKAFPA